MKLLLKIFFIIFVFINFCGCQSDIEKDVDLLTKIKDKKVFLVGVNKNSKPFAYINSQGELEGFDVELIKEISKKLFDTDKIIEFISVTPSNRILSLNSKEVDIVISTMTITEERLRIVDFSNPYYMTGQAILVNEDSNIRSGKDLNGKKVGIVLGTTAATNIRYIASNAIIKGFKNYEDAFEEFKKGNIDAISTDDVILQGIATKSSKYKILPDRYSTEFYGIALRKDEYSKNLKLAINDALDIMEKSGKIKELEKKYNVQYRR